jgi:hypothetical protein
MFAQGVDWGVERKSSKQNVKIVEILFTGAGYPGMLGVLCGILVDRIG